MPTNSTTKGNGQKPTETTGEGFEGYMPPHTIASNPAQFQLHADTTIGALLNASDDQYATFIAQVRHNRTIKIKERAREVADLLSPQRQVEEVMANAQQIVDIESAGAPLLGQSLPVLRGVGGL